MTEHTSNPADSPDSRPMETVPLPSVQVGNSATGTNPVVAETDALEVAFQAFAMMRELYPGFDRQALDAVSRAMQDKYGSPQRQAELAAERAALSRSTSPRDQP